MPETWYATEIRRVGDGELRVLHEIAFPERFKRGWHRAIISIESFSSHKRRGPISARDMAAHRCAPAWAPGRLYILRCRESWEEDQRIHVKAYSRGGERVLPLDVWPVVQHESVWAFYLHIGWDYKSRRYRDAAGRPIRYSSLPEP